MFTTVEDALEHMQSGNARFALHSKVTNNSYRYWMKENASGKAFYVYLIAASGELAFIGSIVNGEFKRGEHVRISDRAPAYVAFVWLWSQLANYKLPTSIEITALEVRGKNDARKTAKT